jgi:hypothetical protein
VSSVGNEIVSPLTVATIVVASFVGIDIGDTYPVFELQL